MHDIEMQKMSPPFLKIWQAAGIHLYNQVEGGLQTWLRVHPNPPFLEHLSFLLENQLFFVRVEDADGRIKGPGILRGLNYIAKGNRGHACLMPMKRVRGNKWVPCNSGWGLIDAATRNPVDPPALVTKEKIEMTSWEIHDLGVQVVRDYLKKQGFQLMSWQGNPVVDPAIWFVGESKKPEWVVVRTIKYPKNKAPRPENWQAIADQCVPMSRVGHFASVAIVSPEQKFDPKNEPTAPLWRGQGMIVNFVGLE